MNARLLLYAFMFTLLACSWGMSCFFWRAAEMSERVSPLEVRHFDALTLVTIGTAGAYEDPELRGPSTAIGFGEQVLLVDAGRGIAEALRAAAIPVAQPEAVLLTSLTAENTVGLDDLIFAGWLRDRETPLRILGPAGTHDLVRHLLEAHSGAETAGRDGLGLGTQAAPGAPLAEGMDVEAGYDQDWDGLRVRAGALSGGPLPALAWRFEGQGHSAVIGGTGWGPEALVEFATGADLLLHEAVYVPSVQEVEELELLVDLDRLEYERSFHTSIEDIGGIASRAGVPSLALVRLRPPSFFPFKVRSIVSKSYHGKILIPEDGDEFVP